jgi:hypothetical protein
LALPLVSWPHVRRRLDVKCTASVGSQLTSADHALIFPDPEHATPLSNLSGAFTVRTPEHADERASLVIL